ncbi:hypothetical protein [Specibacter cremeus]|uniref:hypothetical protein n=1 Tax=Specibacter cremeus TaxID=1629051 RepID=UPI000F79DE4E|nr:hypothetical protein [Specibacter cremeus]
MNATIDVSLRELKFTVGRALHAAGVAAGAVNPVRDLLVDAQALGHDALAELHRSLPQLPAHHGAIRVSRLNGHLSIDGLGQPAFLIAPAVLDLGVAEAAGHGGAVVEVSNCTGPGMLAALAGRAHLHGLDVSVLAGSGRGVTTTVGQQPGRAWTNGTTAPGALLLFSAGDRAAGPPTPRDAAGGHIARLLADGSRVDADLWWAVYDISNGALTPDSILSRQHAGSSVLDEFGQIVGEIGEDDDYPQIQAMSRTARLAEPTNN